MKVVKVERFSHVPLFSSSEKILLLMGLSQDSYARLSVIGKAVNDAPG